jgi:hypothetical protein
MIPLLLLFVLFVLGIICCIGCRQAEQANRRLEDLHHAEYMFMLDQLKQEFEDSERFFNSEVRKKK